MVQRTIPALALIHNKNCMLRRTVPLSGVPFMEKAELSIFVTCDVQIKSLYD